MLQHLSIRNYALIDELEMKPGPGLNILTGETGSGKSILLGAMGLLLGDRADTKAVQEGKAKCIVEGSFAVDASLFEPFFAANDLDFAPITIVRREIATSGTSRAFLNDTPVNLKLLRDFGVQLIDIHSQHQTLQINDPAFQLAVLDGAAGAAALRNAYTAAYRLHSDLSAKLSAAREAEAALQRDADYLRFQLAELEELQLDSIDEEALDADLLLLENADEIERRLREAVFHLAEGELPAERSLRMARDAMDAISSMAAAYEELALRLRSALIEITDIAAEAERLAAKVQSDPAKLAQLTEQRNRLNKLLVKHRQHTAQALRNTRNELRDKVARTDSVGDDIARLTTLVDAAYQDLLKAGKELSKVRAKAIPAFETGIVATLRSLSMPQAQFHVELTPAEKPTPYGIDVVHMRFSANAGRKPEPLRAVASGGELSRLMLAVKKLHSGLAGRGTIVFDEIDTGVSGEVAHAMGRIMREMAGGMQVLCITHLPQIAAKGTHHFRVFKTTDGGTTVTRIAPLSDAERVEEIAQMLSGARTTEAALTNARELLATP